MSFAVIQTGGKQYKVSASEILKIERLSDEEGKTIEFKKLVIKIATVKYRVFMNARSPEVAL